MNPTVFNNTLVYFDRTEQMVKSNKSGQDIIASQEIICQFFIELVKKSSPDIVLLEFKRLFIDPDCTFNSEAQRALKQIILGNKEQ